MTLPKVLIASPIRYRPDVPDVLPAFLDALAALDWPEERREFYFVIQDEDGEAFGNHKIGWELHDRIPQENSHWDVVELCGPEDNRLMGGPRTTGHTTMRLAFLRNLILERFQESDCDLLLMIDSDVIASPDLLHGLWEFYPERASGPQLATISAQLDNRLAVDHEPASNGQVFAEVPDELHRFKDGTCGTRPVPMPAPYATDGSVIEVARAGACTLYPRSVLQRRFRWDPRYSEEHQALFDDLRELGFRHYLIRDPNLCEHRRTRVLPMAEERRRRKAGLPIVEG